MQRLFNQENCVTSSDAALAIARRISVMVLGYISVASCWGSTLILMSGVRELERLFDSLPIQAADRLRHVGLRPEQVVLLIHSFVGLDDLDELEMRMTTEIVRTSSSADDAGILSRYRYWHHGTCDRGRGD